MKNIFIPLLLQTGNFYIKSLRISDIQYAYQDKNDHYTAILALI